MPYRKDIEEMSGGDRYSTGGNAKKYQPRGFFENEIASTPWAILFAFTACCIPIGMVVTGIAWGVTEDARIRRRAKWATLFPVILVGLYCLACAIYIVLEAVFS